LMLDILAPGIVRTGCKLTEAAVLDNQIVTALRAGLLERDIRFLHHTRFTYFARRLALRIACAGKKLSPASPLESHRFSTLITRLVCIGVIGLCQCSDPFSCIASGFALFVSTGEEVAETAELEHHLAAALETLLFGHHAFARFSDILFGSLQIF